MFRVDLATGVMLKCNEVANAGLCRDANEGEDQPANMMMMVDQNVKCEAE